MHSGSLATAGANASWRFDAFSPTPVAATRAQRHGHCK